MRIGVIGAGAIGGAVSALLTRGGHEVEVTARGANLDAIRAGGIRLTGGWGEYTAEVSASERLSAKPDLAVVATKAQDSAAAIGASAEFLAGIPVAIVQNGLESVTASTPLLPDSRVVGALALYAASLIAPGHVAITTAGPTFVGAGDPATAREVAAVFDAVMPTSVTENFVGAQWSKLVVNQVNALPAITGLSVQEVVGIPSLRRLMTRSMRETVQVARASGIRFAELQGLSDRMLTLFSGAPAWAAQGLPMLMARRMGATPNPGSTLQSIRRGGLTEVDYLNGAVVAAGARAGFQTPVNALLTELVHQVERTHEFLTPEQVAQQESAKTRRGWS